MSHRRWTSARWKTRTRALLVAIAAVLATLLAPSADAGVGSPTIATPAHRSVQSGSAPVRFSGTATQGWTVDLVETMTGYVATNVPSDQVTGAWSTDVQLQAGSHTVYAIARNGLGGTSPSSAAVTFQVDAAAPGARIATPTDKTVFEPGEQVRVTGDALDDVGVYAVQLEYWMINKMVLIDLADCPACETGTVAPWTHAPELTVPGHYVVRARAYDVAGNRSEYATTSFVISGVEELPVEEPTVPEVELPEPPVIVTPDTGDLLPGTERPTLIEGNSEPGSSVEIIDQDGGTIGTTVGDQRTGRWRVQASLADGTYTISARGTDPQGNVSPLSSAVTFTVDGFRPQLDIATETRVFLPGQPVVLAGAVNDERGVSLIHLDYWLLNKHVLSANAQCLGCPGKHVTWTHQPDLPLPGYYTVNVYSLDLAGNKSKTGTMTFVKTL